MPANFSRSLSSVSAKRVLFSAIMVLWSESNCAIVFSDGVLACDAGCNCLSVRLSESRVAVVCSARNASSSIIPHSFFMASYCASLSWGLWIDCLFSLMVTDPMNSFPFFFTRTPYVPARTEYPQLPPPALGEIATRGGFVLMFHESRLMPFLFAAGMVVIVSLVFLSKISTVMSPIMCLPLR